MNCCYFSVTLVSELSLLQQVRTICLSSFSGKFLLHPKNQSVKSHRSLPSIRSHSEFHHALVSCPENRDYMSQRRKTNTRSILKSLDTTHSIYRFYASRVTQILQGEREKKTSFTLLQHLYLLGTQESAKEANRGRFWNSVYSSSSLQRRAIGHEVRLKSTDYRRGNVREVIILLV